MDSEIQNCLPIYMNLLHKSKLKWNNELYLKQKNSFYVKQKPLLQENIIQ